MNRVDINAEELGDPSWLDKLQAFSLKVLDALGLDSWDLSVMLCGDVQIRELNKTFRGKDEPTDVLSFEAADSYQDPELGERFVAGDIVISLETLEKNAEYFSVDRDEEFRRLVIHGILHLSGQDHADNDPGQPMLRRQEDVLHMLQEERIF